jgi:uncharacterized protein (TIGR02145 family)
MKKTTFFIVFTVCNILNYAQTTGTLMDPRDGKQYITILIGNQWWTAENLNFNTDKDCWCYNENDTNCIKYGRLYTWRISKKICPEGWHLPSDKEWIVLEQQAGLEDKDSKLSIYEFRGSHAPNLKEGGQTGFSALYGGSRDIDGKFEGRGWLAYFWTNTEASGLASMYRLINLADSTVYRYHTLKNYAFSVRCVKD